jgi:hypothetical protein
MGGALDEDALALAEAEVKHRLDPVVDRLDHALEDLVVVVRVALELERLAEVEAVLDR